MLKVLEITFLVVRLASDVVLCMMTGVLLTEMNKTEVLLVHK
jgi:hypothetical protein